MTGWGILELAFFGIPFGHLVAWIYDYDRSLAVG
jgi:hypothetical protein